MSRGIIKINADINYEITLTSSKPITNLSMEDKWIEELSKKLMSEITDVIKVDSTHYQLFTESSLLITCDYSYFPATYWEPEEMEVVPTKSSDKEVTEFCNDIESTIIPKLNDIEFIADFNFDEDAFIESLYNNEEEL